METTPLLVVAVPVPVLDDDGDHDGRLGGLTLKELLLEAETQRWCRVRTVALWLLWVTWCVVLVAAVALAAASPSCHQLTPSTSSAAVSQLHDLNGETSYYTL